MSAVAPDAIRVQGDFITLEPRTEGHCRELYSALARPEVFAGGFGGGAAALRGDAESFGQWLDRYRTADAVPTLVRISSGPDRGRAIGTSSLYEFLPEQESCLVGYTAYHPGVWGTVVNAECKLLMLQVAFEHGFGRVELRADAANARSCAAITKLGATLEGVRRRDRRRADGTWRDAAIFSITVDDWPHVRSGLLARVAAAREPVRIPPDDEGHR